MKYRKIIGTIFFLEMLFSVKVLSQSSAQNCSNVDVRDQMAPQMRQHFSIPRDQGQIGWCYGFVAADLLGAHIGTPLSSTHVAANYNQSIQRNPLARGFRRFADMFSALPSQGDFSEGGFVRDAVLYNMESDFICTEESLPYQSDTAQGTLSHITFLEDLEEFIEARRGGSINLNECQAFALQRQINPFIPDDLQYLANQLANNHVNEYLANLAAGACPDHAQIPVSEERVLRRNNPRLSPGGSNRREEREIEERRFLTQLGDALVQGIPVGMEYDLAPFILKSEGALPHASVITGRRWVNGQCQYKVRNSHGQSCDAYTDDIKGRCIAEEGSFWITDEEFLDSSRNINFIPR